MWENTEMYCRIYGWMLAWWKNLWLLNGRVWVEASFIEYWNFIIVDIE
jgi:hypothetical protein